MSILKSKQFLQILIIIFIVAGSVILFFFPDVIDNKYEYSYNNIIGGKQQVEALNQDLVSNETTIISDVRSLEKLKGKRIESLRDKLNLGLNTDDLILDIPSILISLEQNAIDNKVELVIDYNSILTNPGKIEVPDFEEDEESPGAKGSPGAKEDEENPDAKEDKENPAEDEDENLDENGEITVPKTKLEEKALDNKEENKDGIKIVEESDGEERDFLDAPFPLIDGVDVIVIPIKITGSYSKVRSYIKYLDEIGFIEPSSVILSSEGQIVTSSITLNVFHEID